MTMSETLSQAQIMTLGHGFMDAKVLLVAVKLCMLLEVGDGFDFTGADFRTWCSEAGFQRFAVLPLGGPASAAIAYK
jgi:hypothetical protein